MMVSLVGRSGVLCPYLHTTNFSIFRSLSALVPAAVNSGDALVNQRKSGLLHGTYPSLFCWFKWAWNILLQCVRFSLVRAGPVCFDFKLNKPKILHAYRLWRGIWGWGSYGGGHGLKVREVVLGPKSCGFDCWHWQETCERSCVNEQHFSLLLYHGLSALE